MLTPEDFSFDLPDTPAELFALCGVTHDRHSVARAARRKSSRKPPKKEAAEATRQRAETDRLRAHAAELWALARSLDPLIARLRANTDPRS